MPKETLKAKVVSINAFEALQERFYELQKRYNSLLQKRSSGNYHREVSTKLEERNNVLANHNDGLCVAIAICGNKISNLESNLVNVNTELSESYANQRDNYDDSVKAVDAEYVGEAIGKTESSNPPIQPTNKATIKPKPKTTTKKKTIRRKK